MDISEEKKYTGVTRRRIRRMDRNAGVRDRIGPTMKKLMKEDQPI